MLTLPTALVFALRFHEPMLLVAVIDPALAIVAVPRTGSKMIDPVVGENDSGLPVAT